MFPAADALASIPGPPVTLLQEMTEENSPFVSWAIVRRYGRTTGVEILRDLKTASGVDARLVDDAILSIESVERIDDLLSPVRRKPR